MILLKSEKINLFCKNDKINFRIDKKIHKLDELINDYEKKINFEYMECPICHSDEFVGYGSYKRNVLVGQNVREINIKRVQCINCKHTHALIPSFIKPYFVYESSYIDFCMLLLKVRKIKKSRLENLLEISRQILRKWEIRFYKHYMYVTTTFKLKELRNAINKVFERDFLDVYMRENKFRYFC